MRFQSIRPATAWALLLMESALAVVLTALLSTVWLVLLLPLGYALAPRTHRWRRVSDVWLGLWLSIGIWAASNYAALVAGELGLGRLMLWWMTGVLPVMVGLGLWWRGGVLARSEIGAQDVRTEFVLLGGASLVALIMLRGLINPPTLLVAVAGLVFVASGLLALSLARQDAAEAQRSGGARGLAGLSAAGPTAGGLVLAGVLTPALVAALWAAFGSVLQILLTPFMLLFAWLASLIPRLGPGAAGPPPGLFDRQALPDLSQLQRAAGPPAWVAWLILGIFALMAIALVVLVVKVLLAWTGARRQPDRLGEAEAETEAVGSPRKDARALLGWLWTWLRRRFFGPSAPVSAGRRADLIGPDDDAREAYRQLLAWAHAQGLPRRDAETTRQFLTRLDHHAPEAAPAFELITDVYEWDRYGHKPTPRDRLAAVRRHLQNLLTSPRP
jgi:Domain of unknown function (DUF4129)